MSRCRSRGASSLHDGWAPGKAVSEAKERVRAALIASGLALPARRITVNLAPAICRRKAVTTISRSHLD